MRTGFVYDGGWCWRQMGAVRSRFTGLEDSVGVGPVPGRGQKD